MWTEVRQPGSSTARKFEIVELKSVEDRKFGKQYYLFSLLKGIKALDSSLYTTDQNFDETY